VHKPQEGRRSLRETPRPQAVKTPKGAPRASGSPTARGQTQGRRSRDDRIRRRGVRSLEGVKAQGRHGRHGGFGSRAATDFRGDQSPEGERGAPRGIATAPIEPTPGGPAGPRGERLCRGRGNLRRVQSQERSLSETRRDRFREEQSVRRVETLEAQRNPGEANPGEVASRYRKCCRGKNPGEARVVSAATQLRAGQTPKRSRRSERCTTIIKPSVVTAEA
jgi:hypothetical protein